MIIFLSGGRLWVPTLKISNLSVFDGEMTFFKPIHPLVSQALAQLRSMGKEGDLRYLRRLDLEQNEIEKQGLWEYFVELVKKGEKYQNENNLLIAFLLGICEEDPVQEEKDLCWVESNDFPDIDTDFLPEDREKIKEWAAKRFGSDRVCSISNYGTYQTKSAIVDVSRVFEIPVAEVRAITTKMDNDVNKLEWEAAKELYPQLEKFDQKYPQVGKIVRRLRGRHYRLGKHAAGIVISDRPLTDIVPLLQREGKVMSAWAEGQATSDLKTVGLVKFDILGLENLNYIKTAKELIRKHWVEIEFEGGSKGRFEGSSYINGVRVSDLKVGDFVSPKVGSPRRVVSIKPVDIDFSDESYLEDKKALEMANRGELIGVFQFDSPGIRELAKEIGIREFEDLVTATCLFRPGPLDSGMKDEFIQRRRSNTPHQLHPILQPILGKTEGIALYQEQTMQIFHAVGGISLPNCEKIRKAMGQKRVSEFRKFKDEFIETGQKRLSWTREEVSSFWEKIEKSSGYLFNRSHGVVYTLISMQCLYLKAHFPREYFAGVLTHLEPGDDRRSVYIREAARLGVRFAPVHINKSRLGFTIGEDGVVYFGFDKIKGVGRLAEAVVANQPYTSFEDFLQRFGYAKKACEPLIKLGAFDDFDPRRKKLWVQYLECSKKQRNPKETVGPEDQFLPGEISRFEAQYYGLFFNHPLAAKIRRGYKTTEVKKNRGVEVFVLDIKQKKTKTGKPYYILSTEDEFGTLSILLWEDVYASYSGLLRVGGCYFIPVDPPGNFPTATVRKDGMILELPEKGGLSEEERRERSLQMEFDRTITAMEEELSPSEEEIFD